jgi:photosystem II stability/assembly factor-like uncharacterized protein
MRILCLGALLVVCNFAAAQSSTPADAPWQMQESGTSASLRGIYSVDGTIAWASGTGGTVLKTTDGGAHWLKCAVPDAAGDGAALDFRGVQAWNAQAAVVLASGPGEKSRLYETTDGCKTWTLLLKNTEKKGFWDAVAFQRREFGYFGDDHSGVMVGDPVDGNFETYATILGSGWSADTAGCSAPAGQTVFAASNSSIFVFGSRRYILGTGGKSGANVYISPLLLTGNGADSCGKIPVPLAGGNESSGIFSLAFRDVKHGVAVGGDSSKPGESEGTAASTGDRGLRWIAAVKPPHGYRSSVDWSAEFRVWIAAGPNGSDASRDDGQTWQPIDDGNWNALSLPFIVGPNGRIARMNATELPGSANASVSAVK